MIVLQCNQTLQLVQLALQIAHTAFQFGIVTPRGIEAFLGERELIADCLAVTGGSFAAGRHQAQIVLIGDLCWRSLGTRATRGVQLSGTRSQAPALTPGGVLLGNLRHRFALGNAHDLLLIGKAQNLTGFQQVDVAVDKGIRVQRLDGQHRLLHRTALTGLRGNLPKRVTAYRGVVGWRADCRRNCRLRLGTRQCGLIDQHTVVTQQSPARPHHLHHELDHRRGQRLARGHSQYAFAVGIDHRRERQVVQVGLALNASLGELFSRCQARRHFRCGKIAHIEQFDLSIQRLVLRRLQRQLAQTKGMRHTGRQRRRRGYC
ncbi:hypothetical protein D3C78_611930 [compost metagenome]